MQNKKGEKPKRDAKTCHEQKKKPSKHATHVEPADRDDEAEYRESEFTYRDDDNEYY